MAKELAQVAGDAALASSQHYQAVLQKCRAITESARVSAVTHYWQLGEVISKAAPREERAEYGAKLILQLECDLAVDRTTLIRSVQLYEQFDLPQLEIGARGHLSWRKLRLLLPLSSEMRDSILKRIRSGELRTDDQVRLAILDLREAAGETKALPARTARHQLQLAGFDEDIVRKPLSTIWNKHDPLTRVRLITALIPSLDLDQAERPEALETLGAMRRQLDAYEERLGEGAES